MKKSIISKTLTFLAAVIAAVSIMSCGSTPAPQPEPVQEEVVEPVEEEVPAEEPEEEAPAEDFSGANRELLAKVEEARNSALKAGAKDANPQAWAAAELEYAAEKAAVENSTADLAKALDDLNARYAGLELYAKAVEKKAKVEKNGFESLNQPLYDTSCEILADLSKPEAAITLASSWNKKVQTADDGFATILMLGFKGSATEERTAAFVAKKSADEVKAYVSKKADYEKAVENFRKGDSAYACKDPESAIENYVQSKTIFTNLHDSLFEEYQKKQAIIEAARKRVNESQATAEKADIENPLGDAKVEGIEEEGTKLLEDDDFSKNAEAQAQIEENIEETENNSDGLEAEEPKTVEEQVVEAVTEVVEETVQNAAGAVIDLMEDAK